MITGYTTVWYESYGGVSGFAVGISVGGALQIIAQTLGYIFIRKGMVWPHMWCMAFVFFGGCLIPAVMRFPEYLPGDVNMIGTSWMYYCWIFPMFAMVMWAWAMKRNYWI